MVWRGVGDDGCVDEVSESIVKQVTSVVLGVSNETWWQISLLVRATKSKNKLFDGTLFFFFSLLSIGLVKTDFSGFINGL